MKYEACKTSIDAGLAQMAAEQAKMDEAFQATVHLTKGLQEKADKSTAKVIRDAS